MVDDFIFWETAMEILIDNGFSIEEVKNIKGIYHREEDSILINLGAEQYKNEEYWTIAELCTALQHEYLHKAIHHIRGELGCVSDIMEKEEEIIANIVGETEL